MPPNHDSAPRRRLRADARDNRRRLLEAARDVLIERGPAAPLEEIARRAGTGIATLYRHFPDRRALIRDVILDALQRTNDEARQAASDQPDPFRALARYMHRAIDVRTAAVIPALLAEAPLDDEVITRARQTGSALLEALVGAAHRAGTLRGDVTAGDIGLLIVRLSRPLPGGFPPETNNSLSHRHLDLLIDGLRATARQPAQLAEPALTLTDLRQLPQPETRTLGLPPATPATSAQTPTPTTSSPPAMARRRRRRCRWRGLAGIILLHTRLGDTLPVPGLRADIPVPPPVRALLLAPVSPQASDRLIPVPGWA